jgi:hypothetical protein
LKRELLVDLKTDHRCESKLTRRNSNSVTLGIRNHVYEKLIMNLNLHGVTLEAI